MVRTSDIALLKVLEDSETAFITGSVLSRGNQSVADVVRLAHIAVDTGPSVFALTGPFLALGPILAVSKAATDYGRNGMDTK